MSRLITRRTFLKTAASLSGAAMFWSCSLHIPAEAPYKEQEVEMLSNNYSERHPTDPLYYEIDNAPINIYEFDPIRSGFYKDYTIKKRVFIVKDNHIVIKKINWHNINRPAWL